MRRLRRLTRAATVALVAAGVAAPGGSTAAAEAPERPRIGAVAEAGPGGLLAWRALLEISDHPVELTDERPSEADLDHGATAILVAPRAIADDDAAALRSFLHAGGRLLIAGPVDTEAIGAIAGLDIVADGRVGSSSVAPVAPAPETAGVGSVAVAPGGAAFTEWDEALTLLASPAGPSALVAEVGAGRLLVLADASPLRNEHLASADNAALAVGVVGEPGRPVLFVDAVESAPEEGFGALPSSWGLAAAGLLLAALVAVAARWRRLGPPARASRPLPPPRHDYVDAMAASLARTRDPSTAAGPLRDEALRALERRTGVAPDHGHERIRAAAQSLGLDDEQADALAEPPRDEDGLIAAAGAMVSLVTNRPSEAR